MRKIKYTKLGQQINGKLQDSITSQIYCNRDLRPYNGKYYNRENYKKRNYNS